MNYDSVSNKKYEDDLYVKCPELFSKYSMAWKKNKLLIRAVISGEIERVQKLIDAGVDVNGPEDDSTGYGNLFSLCKDRERSTALHEAVREKNFEMVQYLLSVGASTKIKNGEGCTPLLLAAKIGCVDIAQKLIKSGAKVDDSDRLGDTSLHYAAKNDDSEMIQLLLSVGASPNSDDGILTNFFHAILHRVGNKNVADERRDTPLLLALKSSVSTKRISGEPSLHDAKKIDDDDSNLDEEIEGLLCSMQGKVSSDEASDDGQISLIKTNFNLEIPRKSFDAARILLKAGALSNVVDVNGDSPLQLAVRAGDTGLVKQLLHVRANPNYFNPNKEAWRNSPLQEAIFSSNVEIVELLLKHGANPNEPDALRKALEWAHSNQILILKSLLGHGADPNNGKALQWLLENNDVEGMQLLLEYGFDPSKCEKFLTVLPDIVTKKKHGHPTNKHRTKNDTRMLSLILDHFKTKGTLSLVLQTCGSGSNWSLLHYAAQAGEFEHVKLLLRAGANPNPATPDDYRTTPLHLALTHHWSTYVSDGEEVKGTEQCVKLLVKAGVNPQNSIVKLVSIISSEIEEWSRSNEPDRSAECDSRNADSEVCKYFPFEEQWRQLGKSRYTWIHHSLKKALTAIKYRLLLENKTAVEDPMPENFTKSTELQRYYRDCKTEIDFMRNHKFDGAITYHDVLTDEDFCKRTESSEAFSRPLLRDKVSEIINIYAADLEECWSQAQEKYKVWSSSTKDPPASPPVISTNSENIESDKTDAVEKSGPNSNDVHTSKSAVTEDKSTMELGIPHNSEIQTEAAAEINQKCSPIGVDSSSNDAVITELTQGIEDAEFEVLDMPEQSSEMQADNPQNE
ncbi:hypothetical protein QAD02_000166 [Eretmocerus hayati]|uniref:Uncharacterized protein n=1 Tax=Eretmocerus hayati TaxID=131215 RepID=A0ACC2NF80_9HYME|nr:hypothetical protein QAD02_000166 [Eretmocerus hayati]